MKKYEEYENSYDYVKDAYDNGGKDIDGYSTLDDQQYEAMGKILKYSDDDKRNQFINDFNRGLGVQSSIEEGLKRINQKPNDYFDGSISGYVQSNPEGDKFDDYYESERGNFSTTMSDGEHFNGTYSTDPDLNDGNPIISKPDVYDHLTGDSDNEYEAGMQISGAQNILNTDKNHYYKNDDSGVYMDRAEAREILTNNGINPNFSTTINNDQANDSSTPKLSGNQNRQNEAYNFIQNFRNNA